MVFTLKNSCSFLRGYFDFEELQPFFSSPYRSKRHEVLHARYISYLCSITPCKAWCMNRLFKPLWVGSLAAFWQVAMSLQGPRSGLTSAFLPHC